METNNKKAYFYATPVIFFWATIASAFKIALKYQTPAQLLLYSSFFSLLIFFLSLLITKKTNLLKISKRQWGKSIFLGFLNPFLYYLILFYAYSLLPAQQAQPLNMTWGIVIVIFAIPLLKQKFVLKDFWALLLTYFGVLFIALKGNFTHIKFSSPLGVTLALGTAFIWALYWILNTKDTISPIIRLFYNFLFGWIFILLYHIIFHRIQLLPLNGILSALYVGMFEYGFTYILWLYALKNIDKTVKLSILIYIVPFISFIFISIFVGEKILFSSIIGAIYIATGILYHKLKNHVDQCNHIFLKNKDF